MPNIENFRAFVLAAELGSFSAAARQMGKAQSAVSTAIANLEIDCDVLLFDRSSRNPVLTKAGEALLASAKGILRGNQEFQIFLDQCSNLIGAIRLKILSQQVATNET